MVLNFGKLTTEEEILKEKMNKYKKKKKELAALKMPKSEKVENADAQKNPETSTDEQAKILKKLTALKQEKAKKDKKYKRTKSSKVYSTEPMATFHTFSQGDMDTSETQTSSSRTPDLTHKFDLYKSFVSSSEGKREQRVQKRGNTIFVEGAGFRLDSLSDHFKPFGNIINIKMQGEKNHAFITYEEEDSAMEAIKQMNESLLNDAVLKVDLARRQPPIESFKNHHNDEGAGEMNLVSYNDDVFSFPAEEPPF